MSTFASRAQSYRLVVHFWLCQTAHLSVGPHEGRAGRSGWVTRRMACIWLRLNLAVEKGWLPMEFSPCLHENEIKKHYSKPCRGYISSGEGRSLSSEQIFCIVGQEWWLFQIHKWVGVVSVTSLFILATSPLGFGFEVKAPTEKEIWGVEGNC